MCMHCVVAFWRAVFRVIIWFTVLCSRRQRRGTFVTRADARVSVNEKV